MMKRSLAALSLFAAFSALAATYKVETDKPRCVYRCGETATFTVTMLDASNLRKSGEMQYATLDNFGTQLVAKVSVDIATGAVTRISGTLSEPGFLRLKLPQTKGVRISVFRPSDRNASETKMQFMTVASMPI